MAMGLLVGWSLLSPLHGLAVSKEVLLRTSKGRCSANVSLVAQKPVWMRNYTLLGRYSLGQDCKKFTHSDEVSSMEESHDGKL